MDDDLGRLDDVHVHLHAHLEEEELRVGLQAVHFQYLGVVGVIYAHPQVGVHARREVAHDDGMLRHARNRNDTFALEAVTVHLAVLGVFHHLVGDILVVGVPRFPAHDDAQARALADLLGAFPPHRVEGRLDRSTVLELGRTGDDALAARDGLGVGGVHVVDDTLDDPVEVFLLTGSDLHGTGGSRDACGGRTALGRSPDGIADELVFLVHQKAQHRGLQLGVELAEDEVARRLCEFPVRLEIARIEFEVNHELGGFQVAFRELVFVLAVLTFGPVRTLGRGHVVLNDVSQPDGGKSVLVLDAGLDVDQPLTEGVVALRRIGEQVFQYLSGIAVL